MDAYCVLGRTQLNSTWIAASNPASIMNRLLGELLPTQTRQMFDDCDAVSAKRVRSPLRTAQSVRQYPMFVAVPFGAFYQWKTVTVMQGTYYSSR
jgi:hypothetical protein